MVERISCGLGPDIPLPVYEFFTKEGMLPCRSGTLRSTNMADLNHCLRYYLYRHRFGLVLKGSYDSALTLGSYTHVVLQHLFLGKTQDEAVDEADTLRDKIKEDLLDSTDDAGFLPGGRDIESVLRDVDLDYNKAVAMAIVFHSRNPFDPDKWEVFQVPGEGPLIEKVLSVFLKDSSVVAISPCDLVLLRKGTTDLYIVDYKTTSELPRVRARSNGFSPQISLYRLVLEAYLEEQEKSGKIKSHTVKGSIHCYLAKPGIKYCPTTIDKGGVSSYIERVKSWYEALEAKGEVPLLQSVVTFGGPALTGEMKCRIEHADEAAVAMPDLDEFYRAGDHACHKWGKTCQYLPLCESDISMWPLIIKDHFKVQFREDQEEISNG